MRGKIDINPATKDSASKNVQTFYERVDSGRGVAFSPRYSVISEFFCRMLRPYSKQCTLFSYRFSKLKQSWKPLSRLIFGIGMAIALFSITPLPAWAYPDPAALAKAVQEIEGLDSLRSGLASTLEGRTAEPTMQTMKEVCKPVGMRAMQLSEENQWQVKQIASKYRNPAHAPDTLQSRVALARFEQNPELMGFWDRETLNGQTGTRYYRRINVEASCLACHGLKNNRPQFVQDNYPQDLAYDFQIGDLRGMYAVFIPDIQAALQQPPGE